MSKRLDLTSLKGDLAGGTTSAVLTVPVSMGYGVLALLPLGDQYISVGVLAGLSSAIFLPLTILLLGDRNALMYAPRSVVTFLLASVVAGELAGTSGRQTRADLPHHLPRRDLRLTVLAGLTPAERALVGRTLVRRVYQRGNIVIKEGDTDRSLFMISKGTASVKVKLADQDREKRLASFSPGAVFGEVALLDEEPRSATVTADEELVCYVLDDAHFRALTVSTPRSRSGC